MAKKGESIFDKFEGSGEMGRELRSKGVSQQKTADALNEHYGTDVFKKYHVNKLDRRIKTAKSAKPGPDPIDEQLKRDQREERLKDENRDLKRLYRRAIKDKNIYEDIAEMAQGSIDRVVAPKPSALHIGSSDTVEDAILGWADWHGGEVIDYEVMQELNRYDPTIMCRRVQATVDGSLGLLLDNHAGTTFENLYIFDLGDSVVGDLLRDNATTNALPVFEAMLLVAKVKAMAIAELASRIPVHYISVPGNHGRRTEKMPWKQPSETADWLIAKLVEEMCADLENVTFLIPKAWTAVVNIRGRNHSLNHGYSVAKGGYGGIPFYSFSRKDGLKTAIEASRGQFVHYRWYGHIHQSVTLPKMDGIGEQFVVGSLKGGDEYALNELDKYSDAMQKLVGCHDKRGVTFRYPLQVIDFDDVPSRYEHLIDSQ